MLLSCSHRGWQGSLLSAPQSSEAEREQAGVYLPVLISSASLPVPLLQGLAQSWGCLEHLLSEETASRSATSSLLLLQIPLLKVAVIFGVWYLECFLIGKEVF